MKTEIRSFPIGKAKVISNVKTLCGKPLLSVGEIVEVINGKIDPYKEVQTYIKEEHKLNRTITYININNLESIE